MKIFAGTGRLGDKGLEPRAILVGNGIELHFRQEHRLKGPVIQLIGDYYRNMELDRPLSVKLLEGGNRESSFSGDCKATAAPLASA